MNNKKTPLNENNNNHHYHARHIEMTGRIEDFNRHQIKDETNLFSMLKKDRACTQRKFIQQEHIKDEIDHSCEAVPSLVELFFQAHDILDFLDSECHAL